MRGFTLIEILVVVAVSAVVLGSFIAYNSASRAQLALSVEQAKIAQLILKAKSLTISSYSSSESGRCGYGFSVDYSAGSYSLNRYDVLDNADCDAIYAGQAADLQNTDVTVLERYSLDPNLRFRVLLANLEDVLFIAPEPKTFLEVGGRLFRDRLVRGTVRINLETKARPIRRASVTVNSFGQVGF